MKTTSMVKMASIGVAGLLFFFSVGSVAMAVGSPQVQTNSATNVQNNAATLNGNLYDLAGSGSATVWFQWGQDTNYGNTTNSMTQTYTGTFSQQIFNLSSNQTYHYRAVAQNGYGITYGQDMTFYTGQGSGNQQIVVNAGPNVYVNNNQSVVLQGSAYSTNGGYITYSWTCTGGSLSNYSIAQPTYTAPYNNGYNNQTTYTCTLTATNNTGQSNSSSTTVYVNYGNNGNNNNSLNVQTNAATNVFSNQATLNGYLYNTNTSGTAYVWFQWGTSTSYGFESFHQSMNYSASFSQNINNVNPNTTYHFRAVAQDNYGNISYGQDMSFYSNGYNNGYNNNSNSGSGTLSITKTVKDISSGNSGWGSSTSANPGDSIQFSVVLTVSGNQTINNVTVQDILPANLTYANNLTVNGVATSGNISQGVSLGNLYSGQTQTITYQAQVAPAGNFSYGQTTLVNAATVSSSNTGTATSSATVYVTKSSLLGATSVSTGLTNNFLTDSFFLPLVLLLIGMWLWKSGAGAGIVRWATSKR
jgi:uncharacterized repeat protein (TIGR01451 family)